MVPDVLFRLGTDALFKMGENQLRIVLMIAGGQLKGRLIGDLVAHVCSAVDIHRYHPSPGEQC